MIRLFATLRAVGVDFLAALFAVFFRPARWLFAAFFFLAPFVLAAFFAFFRAAFFGAALLRAAFFLLRFFRVAIVLGSPIRSRHRARDTEPTSLLSGALSPSCPNEDRADSSVCRPVVPACAGRSISAMMSAGVPSTLGGRS